MNKLTSSISLLLAICLVIVLAVAPVANAGSNGKTLIKTNCHKEVSKPTSIYVSCPTNKVIVKSIRNWNHWGSEISHANGVITVNGSPYNVHLTASDISACGSGSVYRKIKYKFLNRVPKGFDNNKKITLGC